MHCFYYITRISYLTVIQGGQFDSEGHYCKRNSDNFSLSKFGMSPRSKSLVVHYSGKEIQITFHLVNLEFTRKFYLIFIISHNEPHYRIDRLGSLHAVNIYWKE